MNRDGVEKVHKKDFYFPAGKREGNGGGGAGEKARIESSERVLSAV